MVLQSPESLVGPSPVLNVVSHNGGGSPNTDPQKTIQSFYGTTQHSSPNFGKNFTWTPKVCKIMAFMAIIRGLRLLFHILLGVQVYPKL